jgi:hypothetical protein
MLYVEMSHDAARKVMDFLERMMPTHVSTPDIPDFQNVVDALSAFSNDTDVIIDPENVRADGDMIIDLWDEKVRIESA